MSFFNSIKQLPPDPIFGLQADFVADTRKEKVNLGVGAYKNEEGLPQVLGVVRKAEQHIVEGEHNKEYQPISGNSELVNASIKLIYGESSERIFGTQTIGGTGALRTGGDFLKCGISDTIYVSNPTWVNHNLIFSLAGLKIKTYPYYDPETHTLDTVKLMEAIEQIPSGSAILLHACCHNPTGMDLTPEEWKELSLAVKKRGLIPFFDMAYQGLGVGVEQDAFGVRQFYRDGHEMLVANSYSKNFGLYGERIGTLSIVTQDQSSANRIGSQIKHIIRGNYSNPPLHGGRIISKVLTSKELCGEWDLELAEIRDRIFQMRLALSEAFPQFSFLKQQKGMFSFSGLTEPQVTRLQKEFAIYMPKSGRINVAGLNPNNLEYVIQGIRRVL